MTNWKCACGVVNFATDINCKRCGGQKSAFTYSQPVPEIFEHSAPNGEATSGLLKACGGIALLASFVFAFLVTGSATETTREYAVLFACFVVAQGVVICLLFFGFGIMLDNVVAIRKNTQHLAAVRAQTMPQQPIL